MSQRWVWNGGGPRGAPAQVAFRAGDDEEWDEEEEWDDEDDWDDEDEDDEWDEDEEEEEEWDEWVDDDEELARRRTRHRSRGGG